MVATYCTPRDVRLALTPRADGSDASTAASLPEWQIVDAIAEAQGVVNAYLLKRYQITPVEVPDGDPENPEVPAGVAFVAPDPVRGWTRNIAAYLATLSFRRNKDIEVDDPVRLRYTHTMDMLKQVRDRNMDLVLPENPGTDANQGVHVENLYEGRLFGLSDTGLGRDNQHVQRIASLSPWEV